MPLLWDTTASPSAFDPDDWFTYCARLQGRAVPHVPALAIQSVINEPYTDIHLGMVERRYGVHRDDFTLAGHPFAVFEHDGVELALATSAKGSYAAGGLDELIALGARAIVVLNVGGALGEAVGVGDAVVVDAALRDDGISLHYQPPSRYAHANRGLCSQLRATADEARPNVHTGAVWTTTAHFRLSLDRLRAFREEGCLAIDNEAATAFAVANLRGADIACLLHVGLTLRHDRFEIPETENALFTEERAAQSLDIAVAALVRHAAATGLRSNGHTAR